MSRKPIYFKQAHADIALLFRAANQHMTYEDKTHYRELDIQKAQERLSTLLELVRVLEQEANHPEEMLRLKVEDSPEEFLRRILAGRLLSDLTKRDHSSRSTATIREFIVKAIIEKDSQ